jgi:hypothetical protein
MNKTPRGSGRWIMRWFLRVALLLGLALAPAAAMASTTATTTLTVVIPPRPAQGGVIESCDGFVVTSSSHKSTCTVTIGVVDPTLHNTGWRLSLNATNFTCTCGGTLPPNALIVESVSGPVVIDGQPVDSKGGPKLQANSVGRSPDESRPLLVASPGFGNGAYSMTLTLRLSYPANTTPGLYVPTWVVTVSS